MNKKPLLLSLLLILSISASAGWMDDNPWYGEPRTDECTTAIIPGWATPSGRTLLWKSRDVSNWHQEYSFYDLEPYSFIGLNYPAQLNEAECYGGINEVGFAIENSNALNFDDSSGYDDDGLIMYHALQTCETVEDFLAYMDTTARQGRTRPSDYGVFDAYGGAGMLEASKYENFWYDASTPEQCPNGYEVRSNFAYNGGPSHIGQHRHDRAIELIEPAIALGTIDAQYLFDTVARDLISETVDPYPLPYAGYYIHSITRDTLDGGVRTHTAINREITASGFVAQGVQEGEDPLLCVMWSMVGEPIMTPAIPLWMGSFSVPENMLGAGYDPGPLNLRLRELFDYLYYDYADPEDDIIDTYKLVDANGTGVLDLVREFENSYYDYGVQLTEDWLTNNPGAEVISGIQDSLANLVSDFLNKPGPVEDLTAVCDETGLTLSWPPVTHHVIGDTVVIAGYIIFHSDYPYFETAGDSIGFTENTEYFIEQAQLSAAGFYQVRAVK